ncbi:MAG: Tex family protein [Thermovirgaceae bacterium]
MNSKHTRTIAKELEIRQDQVEAVVKLVENGASVPFIARYRKEATGSLEETVIRSIRDRTSQLEELDKRREAILRSLKERGLLTPELEKSICSAPNMARLEDLYLPHRPKRRTRATAAKEKGLEPLADELLKAAKGLAPPFAPLEKAKFYVDDEKGVPDEKEALTGARDILAEKVSEDAGIRSAMRLLFVRRGKFKSRVVEGKESEGAVYSDYFEWEEAARRVPSHRILALFRGEKQGILQISILPPEDEALRILEDTFIGVENEASSQARTALRDGYRRLLAPSMETEIRNALKHKADKKAIEIFAANLEDLLLAPPLGRKPVLAVDPGIRTGCKLTVLDSQGELLTAETIFPFSGRKKLDEARVKVSTLFEQFPVEIVAIGNGTAGRETEEFFRNLELPGEPEVLLVNESGASVYSASDVAREELPDQDVTVRGAVSIGRRLQDPLSELVKIEPKSIGVGQYQHDVDQKALRSRLDDVVVSCVNRVGVEVNSASRHLLSYVSGIGPTLASNIVEYRKKEGPFRTRQDLRKVPRFGAKAFEQASGFLRIHEGSNPLDASAVHPDHYHVVGFMAEDQGCSVRELMQDEKLREGIDIKKYVEGEIGLPTLKDIMQELARPGRDPRDTFEMPCFAPEVKTIQDIREGMVLEGVVNNVTAFGAFVDIGVHVDGLVHVSRMAGKYVKNPHEIVHAGQKVKVRVEGVEEKRSRISLSMKGLS